MPEVLELTTGGVGIRVEVNSADNTTSDGYGFATNGVTHDGYLLLQPRHRGKLQFSRILPEFRIIYRQDGNIALVGDCQHSPRVLDCVPMLSNLYGRLICDHMGVGQDAPPRHYESTARALRLRPHSPRLKERRLAEGAEYLYYTPQ